MKNLKKAIFLSLIFSYSILSLGFFDATKAVFYRQWADQLFAERDYRGALEKYKSAADLKDGYACYRLFTMYYSGKGTNQDKNRAMQMLQKAVEYESDDAQVLVGSQLLHQDKYSTEGIYLLEQAAKKENVLAYMHLASAYTRGVGVEKNLVRANEYKRLANAHGAKLRVVQAPSTSSQYSQKELVSKIQSNLKKLGFYNGVVDGITGPMTNRAIVSFQKAYGYNIDAQIRNEILKQTDKALK